MGYIALFFALVLGGGYAYQQLQPSIDKEMTDVIESGGVFDVLDEAQQAKEFMEGTLQDGSSEEAGIQEVPDKAVGVTTNENSMTETKTQTADVNVTNKTMLVAGGCFWCVESDLEKLPGVVSAVSGYAGGSTASPTYSDYKKNGHREVVEVTYNPNLITFEELAIYTLKHTDPTDDDGSFADRGDGYSSALYYETDAQKNLIDSLIKEIDEKGPYDKPLAVDVESRPTFYKAEDFHQDYYKGTLSGLKYKAYRAASGRDSFIKKYWGTDTGVTLSWRTQATIESDTDVANWKNFSKPSDEQLLASLSDIQYKVTQKNGTEPSFNNAYHDNKEAGIYVDIVSGEPLFSSTHKFDSGTGWPSFTRPIEYNMVTEHKDYKLIIPRTEIRSAIADSHLGHVFNDAPKELGGVRYCMNSASLRFVPKADMANEGYGDYLYLFDA